MAAGLWALNKALKAHDRDLYARLCKDGVTRVFQRVPKGLGYQEWLVCSLTDTWASNGKPRDWGIEPILDHIKFGRPDAYETRTAELKKSMERAEASKSRAAKNIAEDAAIEMRDDMKKAFSDTLTHNLDMSKDVRKKTEKRSI